MFHLAHAALSLARRTFVPNSPSRQPRPGKLPPWRSQDDCAASFIAVPQSMNRQHHAARWGGSTPLTTAKVILMLTTIVLKGTYHGTCSEARHGLRRIDADP